MKRPCSCCVAPNRARPFPPEVKSTRPRKSLPRGRGGFLSSSKVYPKIKCAHLDRHYHFRSIAPYLESDVASPEKSKAEIKAWKEENGVKKNDK